MYVCMYVYASTVYGAPRLGAGSVSLRRASPMAAGGMATPVRRWWPGVGPAARPMAGGVRPRPRGIPVPEEPACSQADGRPSL